MGGFSTFRFLEELFQRPYPPWHEERRVLRYYQHDRPNDCNNHSYLAVLLLIRPTICR